MWCPFCDAPSGRLRDDARSFHLGRALREVGDTAREGLLLARVADLSFAVVCDASVEGLRLGAI